MKCTVRNGSICCDILYCSKVAEYMRAPLSNVVEGCLIEVLAAADAASPIVSQKLHHIARAEAGSSHHNTTQWISMAETRPGVVRPISSASARTFKFPDIQTDGCNQMSHPMRHQQRRQMTQVRCYSAAANVPVLSDTSKHLNQRPQLLKRPLPPNQPNPPPVAMPEVPADQAPNPSDSKLSTTLSDL